MSFDFEPYSSEAIREHEAPHGFEPLPIAMGFIGVNGPIFVKPDAAEPVFGIRVLRRMCNPLGIIHGGMVATMMDMALPLTARYVDEGLGEMPRFMLTISLAVDFLAGAKEGDWLEGRGRILKRTRRMMFIDGLLSVEGEAVARGSGVFKLGGEAPPMAEMSI